MDKDMGFIGFALLIIGMLGTIAIWTDIPEDKDDGDDQW